MLRNRNKSMASRLMQLLLIGLLSVTHSAAIAADVAWKAETAKDGMTQVESRVYKEKGADGKKHQYIEYKAEVTADIALQDAVFALSQFENYKDFFGNYESSSLVSQPTDSEWLVYLFINAPFPLSDADSVIKVTKYPATEAGVRYSYTSAHDQYEMKKVGRMLVNEGEMVFTPEADGKTKITVTSRFSPTGSVPNWMLKSLFPEFPAEKLAALIDLAKTNG